MRYFPSIAIVVATGLFTVGCAPATPPTNNVAQQSPAPPQSPTEQQSPVAQQPNTVPQQPPTAQQPPANQPLFCEGRMQNGWAYRAESANDGFTQIRWTRDGEQPQLSTLTFSETNAQGERVYRGAFRAATNVTLVDLSRGNVQPGSEISVGVEEWGWSRGQCRS